MFFLTIFISRTKLLRWQKHGCYQHITFYDYKADSRGFFLFLKSLFDASIKKGMTNIRIKVQSSCWNWWHSSLIKCHIPKKIRKKWGEKKNRTLKMTHTYTMENNSTICKRIHLSNENPAEKERKINCRKKIFHSRENIQKLSFVSHRRGNKNNNNKFTNETKHINTHILAHRFKTNIFTW